MRVIAGRWRGRKLKSPPGADIRPTTDRVKEAMFSMAGPALDGALVLDLCCGAGSLGIEALSRGAARVILVDTAARSLELARSNLDLCGAEPTAFQLVRAAAETWLDRWTPGPERFFILADPPYQSDAMGAIFARMVDLGAAPGFNGGILEHGRDFRPDLAAPSACRLDTRRYGASCLTVLRPPVAGHLGEGDI